MIISYARIEEILKVLNIIMNTFEFYDVYADMDSYKYNGLDKNILLEEDKWILSNFELTLQKVTNYMEKYHIHDAVRTIINFLIEELSRKYIKLVRRRVWIEEEDPRKKAVYDTLHYILKRVSIILSPFTPHISEYFYRRIIAKHDDQCLESVHLEKWPKSNVELIDRDLIEKFSIFWDLVTSISSLRQKHGVKMRQPLSELILPEELYDKLGEYEIELLKNNVNVKVISKLPKPYIIEKLRYQVKLDYGKLGPKYREDVKILEECINRVDTRKVLELLNGSKVEIECKGKKYILSPEEVQIEIKSIDPYDYTKYKENYILLNMKVDKELVYEGLAKDLVRRIQYMRKKLNLEMMDRIDVYVFSRDEDLRNSINKYYDYIAYETRASRIQLSEPPKNSFTMKWVINEKEIYIGILKSSP